MASESMQNLATMLCSKENLLHTKHSTAVRDLPEGIIFAICNNYCTSLHLSNMKSSSAEPRLLLTIQKIIDLLKLLFKMQQR